MTFRLAAGIEGMEPLEGTKEELFAILDGYPAPMLIEVLAVEKLAKTEFYPHLLRYVSLRLVDDFEDGR